MNFDSTTFYIKDTQLSIALDLEPQNFDVKVNAIASSRNGEIQENLHYIKRGIIRNQPARYFSREGAIAIAKYLESQGELTKSSFRQVCELIEKKRIDRIVDSVYQAIYENSSSLIFSRQLHWLSQEDVIQIFKTSGKRLKQAFRSIQQSDTPMVAGQDFEDRDPTVYFSLSGLEKLSLELSLTLRSEERREYCQRVREVAPPVLESLTLPQSPPSKQQIKGAMNDAKARDGERCIIMGKPERYNNFNLIGHHLFNQKDYPFLSAEKDNIITISHEIHDDFHRWNGGTDKECTVDDFIEYLKSHHPDKFDARLRLKLYNIREILLFKLSKLQRTLPAPSQPSSETFRQSKKQRHAVNRAKPAPSQPSSETYRQLNIFDNLDDRSDFS